MDLHFGHPGEPDQHGGNDLLCQVLLGFIQSARVRLRAAHYLVNNDAVIQALVASAHTGVAVRLISSPIQTYSDRKRQSARRLHRLLKDSQVEHRVMPYAWCYSRAQVSKFVRAADKADRMYCLHAKIWVADDRVLLTSCNFSGDDPSQYEHLAIVADETAAEAAVRFVDDVWQASSYLTVCEDFDRINLALPHDAAAPIHDRLTVKGLIYRDSGCSLKESLLSMVSSAQREVLFASQYLCEPGIVDALAEAAERATVRCIVSNTPLLHKTARANWHDARRRLGDRLRVAPGVHAKVVLADEHLALTSCNAAPSSLETDPAYVLPPRTRGRGGNLDYMYQTDVDSRSASNVREWFGALWDIGSPGL